MQFLMTKKSHTNAPLKGLESYSTKPYYLPLETLPGGEGVIKYPSGVHTSCNVTDEYFCRV